MSTETLGEMPHIDMELAVDIASRLIEFPTVRGTSESAAASWLADFFASRGYEITLQEPRPGRHQVVAVLRGDNPGTRLMFNGHLDNDPLRAGWSRDPWRPEIDGDLLFGAGARNMKGGVATMIAAAEAFRMSGKPFNGELMLACVMGELEGGIGTSYLLDHGFAPDYAIMPEPLGAETIVTEFPGVFEAVLTSQGFSEHSNRRYLGDGVSASPLVDAIVTMRSFLDYVGELDLGFNRVPEYPDLPFFHVGSIMGGRGEEIDVRASAYVSDRCSIILHICYPPGYDSAYVESALAEAIDAFCATDGAFDLRLEPGESQRFGCRLCRVDPASIPADSYLATQVRDSYVSVNGKEPESVGLVLPQCYTAGDSAEFDKRGIPSLYYGPSSPVRTRSDSDDCVSVSEMHTVAQVLLHTGNAMLREA